MENQRLKRIAHFSAAILFAVCLNLGAQTYNQYPPPGGGVLAYNPGAPVGTQMWGLIPNTSGELHFCEYATTSLSSTCSDFLAITQPSGAPYGIPQFITFTANQTGVDTSPQTYTVGFDDIINSCTANVDCLFQVVNFGTGANSWAHFNLQTADGSVLEAALFPSTVAVSHSGTACGTAYTLVPSIAVPDGMLCTMGTKDFILGGTISSTPFLTMGRHADNIYFGDATANPTYTFQGTKPASVPGILSNGTKFTLSSGTGGCATSGTLVGGATAGKFNCTSGAAASTIIINLPTAPNGWACSGSDLTDSLPFEQTASAASSCTIALTTLSNPATFIFHAIGF